MAEEVENLVLKMLREIRGTLDEHSVLLRQHSEEFRKLHQELKDWQETSATAVGLAAHSNIRHEGVRDRLDDIEARLKRLEERV